MHSAAYNISEHYISDDPDQAEAIAIMNDRTKGLIIILFGIVCVSPDAVLVRFLTEGGGKFVSMPPLSVTF